VKSAVWVLLGLAALAAVAWHFRPALAPLIEWARKIEPARVREVNPMR